MEKLELKHYAPRLPYGVKAFDEYSAGEGLYPIFDLLEWLKLDSENWEQIIDDDMLKLILRPLSDLTKPIWQEGHQFIPSDMLCWEWFDGELGMLEYAEYGESPKLIVNVLDYIEDYEKLLEWHFDIHGLIEKGLAIDVNTLEVNPYK